MSTTQDETIFGKLSARTRATIEALLQSPQATKAIEDAEADTMRRRTELRKILSALEKECEAAARQADDKCSRTAAELATAEAAYHAARAAHTTAQMVAYGAELARGGRRRELMDELMQTADPRIADFIFWAENIASGSLPFAVQYWPDERKRREGKLVALSSNMDDVIAAKQAIAATVASLRELQMQAASYVDVSQALMAACNTLAPVLAMVSLNPPRLSARDAEVGEPIMWHGASHWVVDKIEPISAEDRAADRQIKAGREAKSVKA